MSAPESTAVQISEGEPFPASDTAPMSPPATIQVDDTFNQDAAPSYESTTNFPPIETQPSFTQVPVTQVSPLSPPEVGSQATTSGADPYKSPILTIRSYSDKSFVVIGSSKPYRKVMERFGGKWNPRLQGGPAWIFSNLHQESVTDLVQKINSGQVEPDNNPVYRGGNNTRRGRGRGRGRGGYNGSRGRMYLPTASQQYNNQQYGNPKKQVVTWELARPSVGDTIYLSEPGMKTLHFNVSQVIPDQNGFIVQAKFTHPGGESWLSIINGSWKVFGKWEEHTVQFM